MRTVTTVNPVPRLHRRGFLWYGVNPAVNLKVLKGTGP